MSLTIPELSLVLLVGPSGSGKSTFAARHFRATEVLSSDHYRGVVCDDPTSLDASADAFEVLEAIASKRLARGLLTVVDATNVQADDRRRWVELARRYHVLPVAVVLDVPVKVCLERNAARDGHRPGAHVVRRQAGNLRSSVRGLRKEGFRYVHHLRGQDDVDGAVIERPRPWTDRRDERGPFDIVGDVHGCFDELRALLDRLGWTVASDGTRWTAAHPEGRRLVFLGDLVDRGPGVAETLHLVMDLVEQGVALCVPGNHEVKLLRWLQGGSPKPTHGLQASIDQLSARDEAFRARVAAFVDRLVSHFVLDDGKLVVAHAGMRAELAGRASGAVRQFALYGETTGEIDEFGLPVRSAWSEDYRGRAAVVYGHTPTPVATWVNGTICVDTGCVFGGALTALRWPERELVSVPAARVYVEPVRPLVVEDARPPQQVADDALDLADVTGEKRLATRLGLTVTLHADKAAAALEVLSRFAEHPRWLVHLPPTMAPCETSRRPGFLEHPDEAFAYYREHGVGKVVCQEKHMGSRALVLVGREAGAVGRRFGLPTDVVGRVLSRRGRAFFSDGATEAALVERVRAAMDAAGLWEELSTDWALLDAELMPWSAKAQALLRTQYAPVGAAGTASLAASVDVLAEVAARTGPAEDREGSSRGTDVGALLDRFRRREDHVRRYVEAWRRYCWDVASVDDLRLAPFHLLATEGKVHTDRDHGWHLATLARLAAVEPVIVATRAREVDLSDPASAADATAWWEALVGAGGEGMVVKPWDFLATHRGRLLQPALKVRGPEYLRIIYGPEYPEHLDRLRERGVRRKRDLALRELALGLEALEAFVAREPLRHVHASVLGILALEAEGVDPRL